MSSRYLCHFFRVSPAKWNTGLSPAECNSMQERHVAASRYSQWLEWQVDWVTGCSAAGHCGHGRRAWRRVAFYTSDAAVTWDAGIPSGHNSRHLGKQGQKVAGKTTDASSPYKLGGCCDKITRCRMSFDSEVGMCYGNIYFPRIM